MCVSDPLWVVFVILPPFQIFLSVIRHAGQFQITYILQSIMFLIILKTLIVLIDKIEIYQITLILHI